MQSYIEHEVISRVPEAPYKMAMRIDHQLISSIVLIDILIRWVPIYR